MSHSVHQSSLRFAYRAAALGFVGAMAGWALLLLVELGDWQGLVPAGEANQRLLINVLARTATALISTVFACLFLAIPLTANMYTPRLINLFVNSKTNRVLLSIFVVSAAHAVWTAHLIGSNPPPRIHLILALALTILSLALVLPYLFYVFRFLDPGAIIVQLSAKAKDLMHGDQSDRPMLSDWIHHLGNVALRALERADRDVAIRAVDALEHLGKYYVSTKQKHGDEWFKVDPYVFPGFSEEAIRLVNRDRVWVEMEIMQQLSRSFGAAMTRLPDVISAVSRGQRRITVHAANEGDDGALNLSLRIFNNFLRESIKRRDNHAVYDLLYQYRMTAIDLLKIKPERVLDMARWLRYYAEMAEESNLPFARDMVAYDMGRIVEAAGESVEPPPLSDDQSDLAGVSDSFLHGLLDYFLAVSGVRGNGGFTPATIKARLITAAGLRQRGCLEAAARVEQALLDARTDVPRFGRALLTENDAYFWEVTDRQHNLDHIPQKLKTHLHDILAGF